MGTSMMECVFYYFDLVCLEKCNHGEIPKANV